MGDGEKEQWKVVVVVDVVVVVINILKQQQQQQQGAKVKYQLRVADGWIYIHMVRQRTHARTISNGGRRRAIAPGRGIAKIIVIIIIKKYITLSAVCSFLSFLYVNTLPPSNDVDTTIING